MPYKDKEIRESVNKNINYAIITLACFWIVFAIASLFGLIISLGQYNEFLQLALVFLGIFIPLNGLIVVELLRNKAFVDWLKAMDRLGDNNVFFPVSMVKFLVWPGIIAAIILVLNPIVLQVVGAHTGVYSALLIHVLYLIVASAVLCSIMFFVIVITLVIGTYFNSPSDFKDLVAKERQKVQKRKK